MDKRQQYLELIEKMYRLRDEASTVESQAAELKATMTPREKYGLRVEVDRLINRLLLGGYDEETEEVAL